MPQEVDAFLTADEKTVLYLTGFDMTDGALFVMRDEAFLFVDFRYIEAAREEARGCSVVMPEKNFFENINALIAEHGIKTVGFEEDKFTVSSFEAYKRRIPSVGFVKMGSVITEMAKIKSIEEMELIEHAEHIGDMALADTLPLIKPEMTENVDETQHILVICYAEVAAYFVVFDVAGADDHDDFRLLFQLCIDLQRNFNQLPHLHHSNNRP